MLDLEDFAALAYAFMTGIPSWGSSGFCMMDPDTLRKQRWTFVKWWWKKLNADIKHVVSTHGK